MNSEAIDIPNSIEDIGPAWLTAALAGHAHIVGVKRELLTTPLGFSTLARLRPDYAPGQMADGPATLVAKLHSLDDRIDDLHARPLYEAEVLFYRDLAADLGRIAPRCWFSAIAPEGRRHAILMEDLGRFRVPSQIEGCSREEVAEAMRGLAEIHGRWWARTQDSALATVTDEFWLAEPDALNTMQEIWPTFARRFDDVLTPEARAVGSQLAKTALSTCRQLDESPSTLCHGDYRLSNLAFTQDQARPVIAFDWQNVCRLAGVIDLAYFLSLSVETDARRAHESEWLDLYHLTLQQDGPNGYERAALLRDYRLATILAFLHPIMASQYLDVDTRDPGLVDTMARRGAAALTDADVSELLP